MMTSLRRLANRAPEGDHELQGRLFVTLWVLAFTFHYFEQEPLNSWPILLVGIPCLLAPWSARLFGLFVVVGTVMAGIQLPAASNHLVFALLVHAVLGLAALVARRRQEGSFLSRWVAAAVVPATLTLGVVYFFGVFHKLNSGFFDATVSCARVLMRQGLFINGFGVSEPARWIVDLGIVLSLLAEAAILVLILVPRLRRWGVLLGVAFHFLLAWAMFFDFSSFVFALYVLLLPAKSAVSVPRISRWRWAGIAGWVVHAIVSLTAFWDAQDVGPWGLTWRTLQIATWALAVLPIVLPLVVVNFRAGSPQPWRWPRIPAWALLVPLLAVANGATSYVGVRTVANFSMFSNLRTEQGDTNHFLGGLSALQINGATSDLVWVEEVELPDNPQLGWFAEARGGTHWFRRQNRWIRRPPALVPWFELRRAALLWADAGMRDVRIVYTRDGVTTEVLDAGTDPELTAPIGWVVRYVQAFREVQPAGEPVECRW